MRIIVIIFVYVVKVLGGNENCGNSLGNILRKFLQPHHIYMQSYNHFIELTVSTNKLPTRHTYKR